MNSCCRDMFKTAAIGFLLGGWLKAVLVGQRGLLQTSNIQPQQDCHSVNKIESLK